jgi:hypothetical protein
MCKKNQFNKSKHCKIENLGYNSAYSTQTEPVIPLKLSHPL